ALHAPYQDGTIAPDQADIWAQSGKFAERIERVKAEWAFLALNLAFCSSVSMWQDTSGNEPKRTPPRARAAEPQDVGPGLPVALYMMVHPASSWRVGQRSATHRSRPLMVGCAALTHPTAWSSSCRMHH